jgi:hypothetical protein
MLHKINFKQHLQCPSVRISIRQILFTGRIFAEKNLKIPSGTNKIIRMVGGWKAPHIQQ